jgi:hypothetical protein
MWTRKYFMDFPIVTIALTNGPLLLQWDSQRILNSAMRDTERFHGISMRLDP